MILLQFLNTLTNLSTITYQLLLIHHTVFKHKRTQKQTKDFLLLFHLKTITAVIIAIPQYKNITQGNHQLGNIHESKYTHILWLTGVCVHRYMHWKYIQALLKEHPSFLYKEAKTVSTNCMGFSWLSSDSSGKELELQTYTVLITEILCIITN